MEEFEGDLLEGFVTLGVVVGGSIILLLVEEVVSIVATGKGTLLPCLASLQSLLELFPSQIVAPGIGILTF